MTKNGEKLNMNSGKSKLYKHLKAATLYLAIPSDVVKDSTFPFREGDEVTVMISDEYDNCLLILPSSGTTLKEAKK